MRVIVYHRNYGCDSGCCGHAVELVDENLIDTKLQFHFKHPYEQDPLEFAKALVQKAYGAEHVKDLDWENCRIEQD